MKSPYEARRVNDEDEEGGEALSDDDESSNSESDSSSDNNSSDNGHGDDNSDSDSESNNSEDYDSQYSGNDWGEPLSDREDEDDGLYYEEYDDDVDYYDEDIEDDVEANRWSDTDSDQYRLVNILEDVRGEIEQANDVDYDDYPYGCPLNWTCITDVSSRSGLQYDKHDREIPELGSYYDLEPSSLTPYTEEEDDIDARLAASDQKLMVHSLRILTLENAKCDNEKMEEGESKNLPQHTHLNKGKHDLFDEWMDNMERLDAFVTDKPINMEIDDEATDYMGEDRTVLMLREEEAYWEPPAIIVATIELKN